jgi:hypothetical protein
MRAVWGRMSSCSGLLTRLPIRWYTPMRVGNPPQVFNLPYKSSVLDWSTWVSPGRPNFNPLEV